MSNIYKFVKKVDNVIIVRKVREKKIKQDEINKEEVIGDIYGCIDYLCKRCVKCNPLHYWMKKNRLDKINETINELKMYNEKRCSAFINGLECSIIDENFNLRSEYIICRDLDKVNRQLIMNKEKFIELWDMRPKEKNMINMFGKQIEAPRRYKVYGKPYKFTGMNDNIIYEIPLIIEPYLNYIAYVENGKHDYNSVLINWYENDDYIGFHSDNETNLQKGSHIYGFSFGEKRTMRFKDIETKNNIDYILKDNSMIIMVNGCQQKYQHSILKSKKLTGKRINITIRSVID